MSAPAGPATRILGASLLAATAVAAVACSSPGGGSAPTATVTLTPPPASTTSSAPPASPTAASSPGQAILPCQTSGLRVSVGAPNGAAGTIFYPVDFTNTLASPCELTGYPGVSLVSKGSDAGSQIGADAKRTTPPQVQQVTLAPGHTAHAVLGVAEAGNFPASKCNPVTAHWIKVFPPGQRAAAYVPFSTQTCASTAEPTMTITPVSPGA